MKEFIHKYKHAWVGLYGFLYLPWFYYLEKSVTNDYKLVQTSLDKSIPFIEIFILPYLFWFAFMTLIILYFFFKDTKEFYRLALFLIIGMTLFLIICTLWPNGQTLRPKYFERDNIFVDMVKRLYLTDTPTNVFPSIHVYNTLGCYIAVRKSEHLKSIRWVQNSTFIISALIILSTMFLKQHSVLDVVGAGIFAAISYVVIYADEYKQEHSFKRLPV